MNRFNSLTKPLMWFMALLMAAFVAGCGGSGGSSVALPSVVSVAVTPATRSIPISGIQQFTATATYSDGLTHIVTASPGIAWSSANTGVATVSADGIATGVITGTSDITATFGGKTATAKLTVTTATLSSITVTPAAASIPAAGTKQFVATATYSDGSSSDVTTSANWSSGTAGATVGAHTGLATGVTTNVTPIVITATFGGKAATASLTVTAATLSSIAVTPATASVPVGLTQQFVATATYSDASTSDVTTSASWSSGTAGATVGPHTGLATGVTANTTPVVITATLSGKTATAALTVTAATVSSIAVTPATPSIAVSGTQPFTATATYSDGTKSNVTAASGVVWSSSANSIATIVSNTGVATGVAAGTTNITAAFGGQTSPAAAAKLTVSAAAGPAAINLKSISTNNFVILATTAITEAVPVNGAITGNIGSAGTGAAIAVTCVEMQGTSKIHASDATYGGGTAACAVNTSPVLGQAVLDMGTAYTAASDPATPAGVGANLNFLGGNLPTGTNFAPGTYTWGTNVNINGDITLTGSASDVWVFQMSGDLTVASGASVPVGTHVILGGSAQASNVFWRVGGASVTLGTYSTFNGNILTSPSTLIAIQTGAVLHGRALSGTSVALEGNIVGP